MDPTEWLQSLGLERYAAAFRENEIDETVLLRLTAEDLKDIGVGAIGHRRKLLDAFAALRTDAKGEMAAEVASTPSGERRQVTVMFSDLVGSTALSTRMDPEDLREVISAYQKCVADTVQHFGGFVAKYMGDGVLIYFGYPQAHEDDAERAVRAGLELVGAVSKLKTHAALQTRMIDRVAGNKPLPANVRQDIIERTDGIPLFVEEMTKAVLEADGEEAAQRTAAATPSPSVAVPSSLRASLMARLDRLGSAKEVAQVGAVIGREFSYALIAAVAHKEEVELQAALDRLTGAGLLFRQGIPPHATYLFKHGLVQDAAYSTLMRERRRLVHLRIVEILETQCPETAESQP